MTLLRRSLLAAALSLPGLALATATVDAPAPAFTATTADGKAVNLADYKGKTVVLEWTNHDCPYVRKHYGSGSMQSQQKAATAQGIVWLQVISSAPGQQGFVDGATAAKLNSERGAVPTATLLDPKGELGKLYGAQTTPHMYVIKSDGTLDNDVATVLDVYFNQCAIAMSCEQMACAAGFLCRDGRHPLAGTPVLSEAQTRRVNALMLTCGTYDAAGEFAFRIGLPCKSGVGGGIVAIVPDQLSLCVWSPALDGTGNSLLGRRALELFVAKTGLSVF